MSYVHHEYYFDKNIPCYGTAANALPDTNFASYGFAVYKLAWCYYNIAQLDEAINSMKTGRSVLSKAIGRFTNSSESTQIAKHLKIGFDSRYDPETRESR